jgi:hypothetical protein
MVLVGKVKLVFVMLVALLQDNNEPIKIMGSKCLMCGMVSWYVGCIIVTIKVTLYTYVLCIINTKKVRLF